MESLFKYLRWVIVGAGLVALFAFGAPVVATGIVVGAGIISTRVANNVIKRTQRIRFRGRLQVDDATLEKNRQIHRQNLRRRFYEPDKNAKDKGQWNVNELPLDMQPSIGANGRKTNFTVCGIQNIVTGEYLGTNIFGRQRVRFSFNIDDPRRLQAMRDYILENGLVGTRVTKDNTGKLSIISDNAEDICTIVREFYPQRTMVVEREKSINRQYIVKGCKTYEEALAKFNADRITYCQSSADNIVSSCRFKVDGVADDNIRMGDNQYITADMLEKGSFVINEIDTQVHSKKVNFNGNIDSTDEALRSEAIDALMRQGNFRDSTDLVEDRCHTEITNGMPDSKRQQVLYDEKGNGVRYCEKNDAHIAESDAKLVLRYKSVDDFIDVLEGNKSIKGNVVLIDKDVIPANKGEFVVTLPLTSDLLESLSLGTFEGDALAERYKDMGVTRQDIERSLVMDELDRQKYVSAKLTDNPDFSQALVNGVPYEEFRERCTTLVQEEKADRLDSRQKTEQWLSDAARIRQVDTHLDLRNSTVTVHSVVESPDGGITEFHDVRHLESSELEYLASRGDFSKTELKDVIMMSHSDVFSSYRDAEGEALYADPMKSFVNGQKPVLVSELRQQREQQQREALQRMKEKNSQKTVVKNQNKIH